MLPYLGRVSRRFYWIVLGVALIVGVGVGASVAAMRSSGAPSGPPWPGQSVGNAQLDPGTPLGGRAPGFTLTDQFGKPVSLRSFRSKVVVVSFNDPKCTTICPLTTTALLHAKELLGPAAGAVQMLGIAANPRATQVKWVRDYSEAHGMMHKWFFLTGSLPELKRVWKAYGIEAQVFRGQIDHTPATYVVDARGRFSRLYMTEMAYSSVPQLGFEIAQSIAELLPGRPQLQGSQPLEAIQMLGPRTSVSLPRAGGGTVRLGPSSGPHLVLFFDTWESEVSDLGAQLEALNGYEIVAARRHLPPLVAVDEGVVEPTSQALPQFLHSLPHPLAYPVAVDNSGRVGDGYRVHDSPWLELVSGSGRFLFYEDLGAKGWPSLRALVSRVQAALARAKG